MDRSLGPVICRSQVPAETRRPRNAASVRRVITAIVVLLVGSAHISRADSAETQNTDSLKTLSLAQLGSVEVTTTSKEPEQLWKTPAAVYVLTNEGIRRSGATSI